MLRPDRSIEVVYLHRAPVDFRKQMDGLAAIIERAVHMNPFSGALYVFINKRKDKLKILTWDKTGFVIWYKRLEQEKFKWPTRMEDAVVSWSGEQLHWLLEAYDVARMKPHKTLHFTHAT